MRPQLHASVLGSLGIEAGGTEAMLPAQFGDRHARVSLLDEPDDLLGGESTLLHVRPRRL